MHIWIHNTAFFHKKNGYIGLWWVLSIIREPIRKCYANVTESNWKMNWGHSPGRIQQKTADGWSTPQQAECPPLRSSWSSSRRPVRQGSGFTFLIVLSFSHTEMSSPTQHCPSLHLGLISPLTPVLTQSTLGPFLPYVLLIRLSDLRPLCRWKECVSHGPLRHLSCSKALQWGRLASIFHPR